MKASKASVGSWIGRAEGRHGQRDEALETDRHRRLDQHADHAQRMATQRERVLVAGRQLADAEQADQRLELVGQRDDDADLVARQGVAGEARLVVVFDGFGDRRGLAVVARVVAAHGALQLGELADHVGQQIGLGELRGAVGVAAERFVADAPRRDRAGDRAHARRRARPACRACA